jgi:hypothetical protein
MAAQSPDVDGDGDGGPGPGDADAEGGLDGEDDGTGSVVRKERVSAKARTPDYKRRGDLPRDVFSTSPASSLEDLFREPSVCCSTGHGRGQARFVRWIARGTLFACSGVNDRPWSLGI